MKTPKYHILLAHHRPDELYRCVIIRLKLEQYHVCSRCFGTGIGIIAAILALICGIAMPDPNVYILIMPDWLLSVTKLWNGNNVVRIMSGILLGTLYIHNWNQIVHLQFEADLWLVNGLLVMIYMLVLLIIKKTG